MALTVVCWLCSSFQLVLRSYVSHLEKEAAQQMEQLLLEVSLEDKSSSTSHSTSHGKKKSKKKKKKKSTTNAAKAVQQTGIFETVKSQSRGDAAAAAADSQLERNDPTAPWSDDAMEMEPVSEPMPEPLSIAVDSECQPILSTESIDEVTLDVDEAIPSEVETPTRKLSSLNPNALVFQPQESIPTTEDFDARTPFAGKRKFDEYVVSVPWEDVDSDAGSVFDNRSIDGELSGGEDEIDDRSAHQRWKRKQRRREDDAELEWQLQQVYASTSSLFGWDFSRQCELPDAGANLSWNESTLWRTAPKEVVRYFSPGNGDAYSMFHAPQFLPPPAGPPPSRYYFNPMPMLPPGMKSMPPSLHGSFGFESPMVVSSPDFSNAQYHPSNHEDQVDI